MLRLLLIVAMVATLGMSAAAAPCARTHPIPAQSTCAGDCPTRWVLKWGFIPVPIPRFCTENWVWVDVGNNQLTLECACV